MSDNTKLPQGQSTNNTDPVPTAPLRPPPAFLTSSPAEDGKTGDDKSPLSKVSNADFVAAVFHSIPDGANPAVCSKRGDPLLGGWTAQQVGDVGRQCPPDRNNYLNTASFVVGESGSFEAKNDYLAAYHAVMFDDAGTKVPMDRLDVLGLPSWQIETSPGNYQVGYILDKPLTDIAQVQAMLKAFARAGLSDPGSLTPNRWMRMPEAINGKAKYNLPDGSSFQSEIIKWNPHLRYSPEQLMSKVDTVQVFIPTGRKERRAAHSRMRPSGISYEVLKLKPAEHPAITVLKSLGLYKRDLGHGRHEITCFDLDEHTDEVDSGTVFFEPSQEFPIGGFRCQHSHGDKLSIADLYERINVDFDEARHRDSITIVPGAIDQVVKAAEYVLAGYGDIYQSSGRIVHIRHDPETGDLSTANANEHSLGIDLASKADWGNYDGRTKKFARRDPPEKVIKALQGQLVYNYLPTLKGIARQPFYHKDELVSTSGYHEASGIYARFCEDEFAVLDTSRAAAEQALELLLGLFAEVEFATDIDLAAALSAMFTATVRPSLPLAPAFLTTAPDSGIGKSYLNSIVTPFAGPGEPQRTSFPKTSEEATKSVQSHLLTGSAVIEYDDMDCDFLPHGALNRMLTSEHLTDRILGVSKTVTVSTRAVVLASGINVGPVRDMNRRVITIHLARKQQGGITRSFVGRPAKEVRANRGKYVSAVLTIIEAWKKAGCPESDAPSIASYGDEWSQYCRLPLMWLGLPDPAHSLIVQVDNDPDLEQFGLILREWYARYQSTPVTVRKVKEARQMGDDPLHQALLELPVTQNGYIIADKLGWLFKKKANKIIDGYALREGSADGRRGWWVEKLPDPTPPLPASPAPVAENSDGGTGIGDG